MTNPLYETTIVVLMNVSEWINKINKSNKNIVYCYEMTEHHFKTMRRNVDEVDLYIFICKQQN